MKYPILLLCSLFSVFSSHGQFFSLGHEYLIDPSLIQKNKFQTFNNVQLFESNLWDIKNFRSYSVVVFWEESPAHEILYQTDSWGNASYLGVSSGIAAIIESDVFPGFRFQSNCKTLFGSVGKEKIKAFLSLLVSFLNEIKQ